MKYVGAPVALMLALAMPLAASAVIVTVPPPVNSIYPGAPTPPAPGPSQAQLMAQIQSLQQEVAQLKGGGQGSGGAGTSCSAMTGPLGPGSSGAAVTQLQQFLATDSSVYPEAKVTGYYGALTKAAVQRFQVKNNIVSSGTPSTTGYGRVGPKTLAAILAQCGGAGGGTGDVSGFIQVSPIQGPAPLFVNVLATVNAANSCAGGTYAVDFGEGGTPQQIVVPSGGCKSIQQTLTHTYLSSGTYQVTLTAGDHSANATVIVN